jgi:hypothetical protein
MRIVSQECDGERVDLLTEQCEVLRSRLLRLTKALLLAEEQRSRLLMDVASGSDAGTLIDVIDSARAASTNADIATSIMANLEQMTFPTVMARADEIDLRAERALALD